MWLCVRLINATPLICEFVVVLVRFEMFDRKLDAVTNRMMCQWYFRMDLVCLHTFYSKFISIAIVTIVNFVLSIEKFPNFVVPAVSLFSRYHLPKVEYKQ